MDGNTDAITGGSGGGTVGIDSDPPHGDHTVTDKISTLVVHLDSATASQSKAGGFSCSVQRSP